MERGEEEHVGMDHVVNSTPNLELKREREDGGAEGGRGEVGRVGERHYGIGLDYRIGPGQPTDWMMGAGRSRSARARPSQLAVPRQ